MTIPETAIRRETGTDRRREISDAACALIVEKGLEGLRTRDIAARVGINIATLHYHVPSKEALIGLVTESIRNEFKAQSVVRPRAHMTPAEQLRMEFIDFREMLDERSVMLDVLAELTARARRDATVAAAIRPMQSKWQEILATILAAGRDNGDFRADLDPLAAAVMVLGALVDYRRTGDLSVQSYNRLTAELTRALRNPNSPFQDLSE